MLCPACSGSATKKDFLPYAVSESELEQPGVGQPVTFHIASQTLELPGTRLEGPHQTLRTNATRRKSVESLVGACVHDGHARLQESLNEGHLIRFVAAFNEHLFAEVVGQMHAKTKTFMPGNIERKIPSALEADFPDFSTESKAQVPGFA